MSTLASLLPDYTTPAYARKAKEMELDKQVLVCVDCIVLLGVDGDSTGCGYLFKYYMIVRVYVHAEQ